MRQAVFTRLNRILLFAIAMLLTTQLFTLQALRDTRDADTSSNSIRSAANTSEAACTATVNVRRLNQRTGPGQAYAITGSVTRSDVLSGISWDAGRSWLLVATDEGSVWMYAPYMSLSEDCQNLSVYSGSLPEVESNTTVDAQMPPQGRSRSRRDDGQSVEQQQVFASTPVPSTESAQPSTGSTQAETVTTGLSTVFTPQVQYWAANIAAWAETYQLDPNLIATVIQIESCGDPTVGSSAGAQGLFQVMPFHFTAGEDMLDIETNARRGLEYLKGALERSQGNVGLALVGYNGGYGAMSGGWAAETRQYYYWGTGIYAEATSGAAESTRLEEWLTAGGSSLCSRASTSLGL
ncbi:MAG: lytic transglycosylase domain-containing protein [Chloroflexi bacterium]|nr:lytic transglycosylase domain-containing protein [Chloroflexota bacterium]